MRRPALQSGEQQPGDDHRKRTEPDHHSVNPTFDLLEPRFEPLFHFPQFGVQRTSSASEIGLGGDIVVDFGRDAFGIVAFETGALEGAGQSKALF